MFCEYCNIENKSYEERLAELPRLEELVKTGIKKLRETDPEDDDYMRLRVIARNEIWVALTVEEITFMKPEDY